LFQDIAYTGSIQGKGSFTTHKAPALATAYLHRLLSPCKHFRSIPSDSIASPSSIRPL
jgi:hypothetical protein